MFSRCVANPNISLPLPGTAVWMGILFWHKSHKALTNIAPKDGFELWTASDPDPGMDLCLDVYPPPEAEPGED
ncbi:hypothetical protein AAFF_G00384610 [Aldrovandia affinis]|uniref:Uncharacterized protein n=1 Tax=Aldrovandia affinis TaxID=143900 RepID=A0AAD7R457_9TELE|nr:hypothetical protein AAFF_G00384610 [Aldrovandia affinis]